MVAKPVPYRCLTPSAGNKQMYRVCQFLPECKQQDRAGIHENQRHIQDQDFKLGALPRRAFRRFARPFATMEKQFSGPIEAAGSPFHCSVRPQSGLGTYCAMILRGFARTENAAPVSIHSAATSESHEPRSSSRSLKAAEPRDLRPIKGQRRHGGSTLTAAPPHLVYVDAYLAMLEGEPHRWLCGTGALPPSQR